MAKNQNKDREKRLQKRRQTRSETQQQDTPAKKRIRSDDDRQDKVQKRMKHTASRKDKTRRQKKQKPQPKEEEEEEQITFWKVRQHKCTLVAFWREMNKHKNQIPLHTWAILGNTCFWPLIKPFFVDIITEEQITKKKIDLQLILKHYESDTKKFKFGEVVKKITPDDVKQIFGIPTEGKDFTFNKKETKRKNPLVSKHFSKCKDAPTKTQVSKALIDELKDTNKANPAHVASLLIMSLFVSFLFSNCASKITWDLVNVACKVKDISYYNWSLIVIQFWEKGLTKHNKEKPVTLSGCLLLILYWFLDNTKAKRCIAGREGAEPTFIKWLIQNIFDWETYKSNPRLAEQWIEDRPWNEPKQKTIDLDEDIIDLNDDAEDMTTPTFSQWVSQATQDNGKEATQAIENLRSLIQSLEDSVDGKPTSKQWNEMQQEIKKLCDQNENLLVNLPEQ